MKELNKSTEKHRVEEPGTAATVFPVTTLDEVVGLLRYKGKPKTLEQMNAGIRREVARRHKRGRY
jgi:hypothetical protein